MKVKSISGIIIVAMLSLTMLSGCGSNTSDISLSSAAVETDIRNISVPDDVRIVGLGEAGHGVKEYHQMKADVFKALVNNNGCRTFIIEGDFGGALKVNDYIHGGSGTAEEVVEEIGFAIYCTQEMVDLIDWMRFYNETAGDGEDLRFYGMDMQRYDNNKEYLFSVLDQSVPELSETYQTAFLPLTDDDRLNLGADVLEKAAADALTLLEEMDTRKTEIADAVGQEQFDIARECANTIYMCSEVMMSSDKDYNSVRDNYMSEKVEWFMQREKGLIFINGHNGHIGKTSVSNYDCLGELLDNSYGDAYFAIGTDAMETEFNSQDSNGEFQVMEVTNENALNHLCDDLDGDLYYVDFSKVSADEKWQEVLSGNLSITTLNVGIAGWQQYLKTFYTSTIVPEDTFDGMVVFEDVSPTTLIKE